jgi:putative phage-type endonuclease
MNTIINTKNLTKEEWLKYRTQGIGGSDVSVIAGINPFKSAYTLWLEKTGQIELEETENNYTHFGTLLEPIIRKEFTMRTGLKVRQKHMLLQSEKYPFMYANLDGVINEDGEMAIFEAKTASEYKLEVWENEVPAPYILQIQHYMAVTGAKKTYIAALVGGNKFYWHEVKRDDEMIEKIIAMEKYFWEVYVLGGMEPVPDGSESTTKYFNEKFKNSNGETIELPEEVISVCDEYERISEQIKDLENEKNAMGNKIKGYMKEAEIGVVGDRRILWQSISKSSIDTKRLKTEKPDIYADYLQQRRYRRLSVA